MKDQTKIFKSSYHYLLEPEKTFDSFVQGIAGSARSDVTKSRNQTLTESNKAFSEGMDKWEEEAGVEFSDATRNVFKANAGVESINETMGKMFTALGDGKDRMLDPVFFNDIRNQFTGKFTETWRDIAAVSTPEINQMYTGLLAILNQDVPMTAGGITGWMANVQNQMQSLVDAGALDSELFTTSMKAMNEANLETVKQSLGDIRRWDRRS